MHSKYAITASMFEGFSHADARFLYFLQDNLRLNQAARDLPMETFLETMDMAAFDHLLPIFERSSYSCLAKISS